MRSGKEGACIEKFMKDATSIQKKVSKGYFGDDYGYQTWIYSRQPSSRFAWRGAYGQMVAFDPVKERVLIVFRHRSFGAAGQAIGGLMARWERMP
jgi:CubicO group peptidase (beta-lactamase class C family)